MSHVWPILHYDNPRHAVDFLAAAFGFLVTVEAADAEGDPIHVELRWPAGGTIVVGSTRHTGGVHEGLHGAALYVVTDDVDGVHARAERHGAEIVNAPHRTRFGSGVEARAFTARDPEGTLWTFGTYGGA